jgi:hypothetical protein
MFSETQWTWREIVSAGLLGGAMIMFVEFYGEMIVEWIRNRWQTYQLKSASNTIAAWNPEQERRSYTPDPLPSAAPTKQFPLQDLVSARHALVIGQSGAGKTVLSHTIASIRAKRNQQVIVCDPDSRPGMWPGCQVVGGGDDFAAIESRLQHVQQEIESRRKARSEGQRDFAPLTLVMSEASDILAECPTARTLFETMLRRARKLNASLLVDVQDDQVRTLDIQGASKLKVNFSVTVEMRLTPNNQRVAKINGEEYPVPTLPDPENIADTYRRRNPEVVSPPKSNGNGHHISIDTDTNTNTSTNGIPDIQAKYRSIEGIIEELAHLPATTISANKIYEIVGGNRNRVLAKIRGIRQQQQVEIET